jgi:hypothetical protein
MRPINAPIIFFGVAIPKLAGSGDDYVFARLHFNACVNPGLVAGDLHLLRNAFFPGRSFGVALLRCNLRRRGFTNELGTGRILQEGNKERETQSAGNNLS